MDSPGTVLIVSQAGAAWSAASDILTEDYGYRVLVARSGGDAAALRDAHIDLVIAEETGAGAGRALLAGLRVSHADIVRVLVLEAGQQDPALRAGDRAPQVTAETDAAILHKDGRRCSRS